MMQKKHIILIGFMGTGKSSVGKELAEVLNRVFIDTDLEIEKKAKMTISDFFEQKGEEAFRKLETEVLSEVLQHPSPSVIATGGGVVLSEKNRNLMTGQHVILLQASMQEVYQRIKNTFDRPLLKGEDLLEKIITIYDQRKKIYQQSAEMIVATDRKTVRQIAEEIADKLKRSSL